MMAMCSSASGRRYAKSVGFKCPPQTVASEFKEADKKSGKLKEAFRNRARKQ